MSSGETIRFPQLNHTNYTEWALCMEAILICGGFWDLVTGDEELDVDDESGAKGKLFRKREAQCKAEMVLRVEDSQLPHMADRSPKAVWNSLAAVHRAHGFGSRLQLHRNFITASMNANQSMESWIGKVRGLANRLQAIDVKILDEDIIVVLTAGLPSSYTPVVISFDAIDNSKLTLDFVITRLLNEEGRQTTLDVKKESDDDNTALNASKFSSKIQCFYCLLMGHFASDCPKKAREIKEKEDEGRKRVQHATSAVPVYDEEYAFTSAGVIVDEDKENVAL
jgi:hypothetical protein